MGKAGAFWIEIHV